MRHTLQFLTILALSLCATGCHHPSHNRPVYWHENHDPYRNPDQHWSRGPHTDH